MQGEGETIGTPLFFKKKNYLCDMSNKSEHKDKATIIRLGKLFRDLRESKQLEIEQLAAIVGVKTTTISNFENGRYIPPIGLIDRLLRPLGFMLGITPLTVNRYLFSVKAGDAEVNARVEASHENEAIARLTQELRSRDIEKIDNLTLLGVDKEIDTVQSDRYRVKQLGGEPIIWQVEDLQAGIVIYFEQGNFNQSQRIDVREINYSEIEMATILRKIGDFLQTYHRDLLY